MRLPRFVNMDFGLLAGVLALLLIGLPAIYSASHITSGADKVLKQGIFAGVGLAALVLTALVDYRVWSRFWRLFYMLILLALIAVFFTPAVNGAHSWFDLGSFRLQPSEFAKAILILAFSALLSRQGPNIHQIPTFLRDCFFFMVPVGLVLIQPDFGTAMVLFVIWFAMAWLAGTRWWLPVGVVVSLVLLLVLAWNVTLPGGRGLLKPYQKARLDFIHADPAGAGYHQRQARIAIGAGQLWGKGFLNGTQARRGFLPEQDTDFIFAVIGEEFGFLGCLVVLGLYLFVVFRLLRIAEEAETMGGRVIAGGVAAMLAIHVVINVGMNLTLMPVTGIPLPFISYGGSSLLTNLIAIGFALNISRHRQPTRRWAAEEQELIRV